MKLSDALNQSPCGGQPVRLAVVSNITLEPWFIPFLSEALSPDGLSPEVLFIPLELVREQAEDIRRAEYLLVWLYPDGYVTDGIHRLLEQSRVLLQFLREHSGAPIFWMGTEGWTSPLRQATGLLYDLRRETARYNAEWAQEDVVLLDLEGMIAAAGLAESIDRKGHVRWNAPYGRGLIREAAAQIARQIRIDRGLCPKCLVLDADGVLWGGVLSEDGINGIRLGDEGAGRAYRDFQRFALELWNRGILLALCSKNDYSDLMNVLETHSGMVLRREHFAAVEAGWEDKPAALRRIADHIGIGLDSLVFVDDSRFEAEAVRHTLPEVRTIRFDKYTIYEALSCFHLPYTAGDDARKRQKTYTDNLRRQEVRRDAASYAEYLAGLEQTVTVRPAAPHEYARIAELSQRANRCTNGRRLTAAALNAMAGDTQCAVYSVSVSDRFGDLGLIGAMVTSGSTLVLFCLSCRALGRGIEDTMLKTVRYARYDYLDTQKNATAAVLLGRYQDQTEEGQPSC